MTKPEQGSFAEGSASEPMQLFYDPAYVMAETAFDTTRKAAWVADSLAEEPVPGVGIVSPQPLTPDEIASVHTPAYVEAVRTGEPHALAGSNGIGWDPALFGAVAASNGGAVAAATRAFAHSGVAGSLSSGLHHAKVGRGDGFCTFNGIALAARRVLAAGDARILVLDLDAHCGGGTHELLGGLPPVVGLDVAVDAFDRYRPTPGWSLDLVSRAADYLPTIERRLDALAGERFDLVLYNAGMDPYEGCHVGGLSGIDHGTLAARERLVFERARAAGWPIAFVLAGGYATSPEGRRRLVALHRETILAAVPA